MKHKLKAFLVLIALVLCAGTINTLMWAKSYSYACWRVTHPFGPDLEAFSRVLAASGPSQMPALISKMQGPDEWWVESAFKSWFPEVVSPRTNKRAFWEDWWATNQHKYVTPFVLRSDPQF